MITVFEQLQSLGKADECGGLVYLNALAQSVPSAANMRRYAEIVRERAVLRKLVAASDEIATSAFNPQGRPVAQILDEAEGKIFRIGEEGSRMQQGFQGMDKLVVQLLDRVTELHENGAEDVTGVRTGFYDLDRMTSGLQPGDLIVLAARPSMGKTALALNIAEHVARATRACRWWCSRWKWAPRSSRCAWSARSAASTRATCAPARCSDDEWRRLTEAVEKLGNVSLFIDETRRSTPSRAARPRAAPGAPVRQARPDRRRLPAADERQRRHQRREPRHRDRRDLARPEVARQGAAVPGDRAVAAQPQRRERAPTSGR